ncbi:protein ABHD15 [Microcaecilia unicolor]|uniref:Protein ABHD15 n=1 Tax=Microcaecilia unicolor TaxID=1415580 RepID=A0A6P7WFX3_9AMPH|nr:protein ABHD15-like [Microcaecilia unicolor]
MLLLCAAGAATALSVLFLLLLLLLRPRCRSGGSELLCKPSTLASYLREQCSSLREEESGGGLWRALPSVQSAIGLLGPPVRGQRFLREYLQLSDQGLVALDWAAEMGRRPSNPGIPLLLIIPNSFGKITRNVSQLCHLALLQGYRPVIFNRRCQNDCPLNTVKLQPYGDPSDLGEAVQYIRHRHPGTQLFAVGESTGAGLLFSYLGECGSSSYVTAAGCISPLFRPQDWFEAGCPWLWQRILLLYQKMELSRYATVLGEVINTDKLFGSGSLMELEETLFCVTGSKTSSLSWETYWERNDPLRDVDEVAIPVLCICSQDDPIRGDPKSTLPFELFETNPHFFLLLTQHGGHCGFIGDNQDGTSCSHKVLLDFFKATAEFFRMEDGRKGLSRKKGTSSSSVVDAAQNMNACIRKTRCPHNIHDIYNWQRSYTR